MRYEYLLFNIIIFSGPLLILFSKIKGVTKPNPGSLFLGILIGSSLFVLWDALVVNYFWFFNPYYITGFSIFGLPVEELLFFISVPLGCLLLWVNYKKYFKKIVFNNFSIFLIFFNLFAALIAIYFSKFYTGSVALVFLAVLLLDIFLKTFLFRKGSFVTFVFGLVNVLTFIFNLYLTARPVVLYNTQLKTNFNIITIPVEDFLFGMALISLIIIIYEKLDKKSVSGE